MKNAKFLSLLLVFTLVLSLITGCNNSDEAVPSTIDDSSSVSIESSHEEETSVTDDSTSISIEDDYEEGTSDTDEIVNTTAADKVILVVSFGTSFNQSRNLTIGAIETAVKNEYPDYQIRRAFTSQIIIDKLAEREGLVIDNVTEAMNRLVLDNVKEVIVQPTTVMNGFEYDDMIEEVMTFTDKFESLKIGKNLLADDIDYDEIAELLVSVTSSYRADGTAIVYMGHGTEHEAGSTYTKLQDVMISKGYNDYIIGTVEHGVEIDEVREKLADMDVKKVVLRPLMVVAGDHANNDMAGDEEDSWKVILEEDGYEVVTVLEGLGQIKGVQDIYIRHIQDALGSTDLSITPVSVAGVTPNRIKNGTYSIETDTDSSMFKIINCELTVTDESMNAVVTLSGTGYGKIFMGTVEELIEDEAIDFTLSEERHSFTVSVSALDKDLPCAALGTKSGNWFDHNIVFKTTTIPDDDFLPCKIYVSMEGGSGKASIDSPANLTYRDGIDFAEIVWSSPNYTYMLVDGIEYLPTNTDGNSVFEIPVKLDTSMKVIACTVAMSEPKEIEYTFYFDSTTIQ